MELGEEVPVRKEGNFSHKSVETEARVGSARRTYKTHPLCEVAMVAEFRVAQDVSENAAVRDKGFSQGRERRRMGVKWVWAGSSRFDRYESIEKSPVLVKMSDRPRDRVNEFRARFMWG